VRSFGQDEPEENSAAPQGADDQPGPDRIATPRVLGPSLVYLLASVPRALLRGWGWFTSRQGPSAVGEFLMERADHAHPPRLRDVYVTLLGGAATLLVCTVSFALYVTWGMPTPRDVWSAAQQPSFTFVDRAGRVIMREDPQNAPPVDLKSLPLHVIQAVIAIEDRRFYQHRGVDLSGLFRAVRANLTAGRVVQGGSTLTQQLAKNLFLNNERSFRRKAQEVVLALWLERAFSKREILALYLSRVYFGAGAFGVEAASERYFDKPARDLSLHEAALLAGLLKAPSRLNPARQTEAAAERTRLVLSEMQALGYISATQREAALRTPLVVSLDNPNGNLGYFRYWIEPLIEEVLGGQRDDFIIETTLDLDAQRAGERAIAEAIAIEGKEKNIGQGALLALDDAGGVRTMVGGVGFEETQFNRTTQARRQPGSSFKYFIYLAALENGLTPWAMRQDAPIVIGDWAPGNYENKFYGLVTVEQAFARSLNMVAIQVALEVGGPAVLEMAQRLGVRSPLHNYRSLALGAQELTLMEMVASYGAVANGGYRVIPHGVAQIRRASDNSVVWSFKDERAQVLDPRTIRLMNKLTRRVVEAGTGTRANLPDRMVAGKTGTSNGYRDAWFIGYTPGLIAGVWMGNDNFTPMNRVTGGTAPTMAWRSFMETALQSVPAQPLPLPLPTDIPVVVEVAPMMKGFEAPPAGPALRSLDQLSPPSEIAVPSGEG